MKAAVFNDDVPWIKEGRIFDKVFAGGRRAKLADTAYRLEGLGTLAGSVLNLHVFQWLFHPMRGGCGENIERRPLAGGEAEWIKYLSVELPESPRHALMEFVCDDDPEYFKADAPVLRRLVQPSKGDSI